MICEPAAACARDVARGDGAIMVQDVWPGNRKGQRGPNLRIGDAFTICAGKRKAGVLYVPDGADPEALAAATAALPEDRGAGAAAGNGDDGGEWSDARMGETCRLRMFMPVEVERFQGLPDDHTRWGADGSELSDTRRINLAGRAVPPPAVCAIAGRIAVAVAAASAAKSGRQAGGAAA